MEHHQYGEVVLLLPVTIDEHDFACMHDTIIDATHKHLNQEEILEVIQIIPEEILNAAISWGFNDTDFRQQLYQWVIENKTMFDQYTTWED